MHSTWILLIMKYRFQIRRSETTWEDESTPIKRHFPKTKDVIFLLPINSICNEKKRMAKVKNWVDSSCHSTSNFNGSPGGLIKHQSSITLLMELRETMCFSAVGHAVIGSAVHLSVVPFDAGCASVDVWTYSTFHLMPWTNRIFFCCCFWPPT